MPYIPQFNKISLQEMAYAPALMRQQHDEAVAKQMELAEALKFDYLQQDAPGIEPILQKYSSDIEKVSKDLATSGFSHDLKNKVLGLRSKYVGDEKIRKYKKNYADAMAGWEERKKSLLQQRASGEDIQAMKRAYFSPEAYKGAYDEDGIYNEFTPGATSNVYDISEDIKNKFANIGSSEVTYGGSGTKAIREVLYKGTPHERVAWKILDSTGGTKFSNLSQREAVKELVKSEYTDPSSDRALYAKLTNKSPEYIEGLVNQWSEAMNREGIGNLAQTRGNYMFDKEQDVQNPNSPLLTYEALKTDSKQYKSADEREKIISGEIKGKQLGVRPEVKGVEAYIDTENPFTTTSRKVKTQEETITEQNKRTPRYLTLINPETQKPYTAKEAAIAGARAEKNASAYKETSTAMNIDPKSLGGMTAAEVVLNNLINPSSKSPITHVDKDKKISKQEFINIFEDEKNKGVSWKDAAVKFDGKGDITLNDFSGNTFKINARGDDSEGVLEKGTGQLYREVYLPILEKTTSFDLFDNKDADKPVIAPDGSIYDVITYDDQDPYNINNRLIREITFDEKGTQKERVITPEQFKQSFLIQTALGIKNIKAQ